MSQKFNLNILQKFTLSLTNLCLFYYINKNRKSHVL